MVLRGEDGGGGGGQIQIISSECMLFMYMTCIWYKVGYTVAVLNEIYTHSSHFVYVFNLFLILARSVC